MTRQRKLIEHAIKLLTEASKAADRVRTHERDHNKARIVLAVAVDDVLEDLRHALSTAPCNHGLCLGTTIGAES